MKPLLKKIIVPSASAMFGGLAVVVALKMSPTIRAEIQDTEVKGKNNELIYDDILKEQNGIKKQFDSIFDDGSFGQNDPFEEMRKMRKQMENRMERFTGKNHATTNPFDSWFSDKFGGGSINDISKREDNDFVYYDIKIDDVNTTSINTKVENGYITVFGTIEKKDTSGNDKEGSGFSAQSFYKSTFNRTFPLPDHVDQNKMQMVSERDKIILKFPKVKS